MRPLYLYGRAKSIGLALLFRGGYLSQMKRRGSPPKNLTVFERFMLDVSKTLTCWIWVGSFRENEKGMRYGRFHVKGKTYQAHRWIWSHVHRKEIRKGHFICHTCDNPICVNPDHLFEGTPSENNLDMGRKGRHWAQSNPEAARKNLAKASKAVPKGKKHWNYKHGRYSQA